MRRIIGSEEFKRLYLDPNVKESDMARQLGCTPQTIRYWAKKMGLPPRKKGFKKLVIEDSADDAGKSDNDDHSDNAGNAQTEKKEEL